MNTATITRPPSPSFPTGPDDELLPGSIYDDVAGLDVPVG